MERGTFRRRIGEHELVRRGRLAATAPRHDVKGKFRIPAQVRLLFGRLLNTLKRLRRFSPSGMLFIATNLRPFATATRASA